MLNRKKWTSIDNTLEQRNNLLVSIFAVVGAVATFLQLINAFYHKLYVAASIDFFVVLVLIVVYIINEKRNHRWAKILLLGSIDLMIFGFANIVPRALGISTLFFPVIAVSALIFNPNEKLTRTALVVFPVILFTLLEVFNYHFFGDINIHHGIENNTSYYINLFVSVSILVFVLLYINEVNRKIEIKRKQVSSELKDANESLQKTNTELDHFVYSTSHDLKAPLSSILGLINIAKHEIKDEKSLDYFNMINKNINKLNLFIKDIIELSRNSRLDVTKQHVNLTELVNSAIDNNRYMKNAETIEFTTDMNDSTSIEVDKARLEIVLNNLISNAIKYHKNDGARFVDISINKNKEHLTITVKDNGTGIENEHQGKVFEMFYRGHESSDGSGLGLYIVHDVVKKMNGNINLNSKVNEGTEINISLPSY